MAGVAGRQVEHRLSSRLSFTSAESPLLAAAAPPAGETSETAAGRRSRAADLQPGFCLGLQVLVRCVGLARIFIFLHFFWSPAVLLYP